ncbi:MAG: hypothetical protein E6I01_03075 [Chloroflexi bacterium]|nr:MAG: hypothetical protein E6I01_03075 [Chloroflexota bacterium]
MLKRLIIGYGILAVAGAVVLAGLGVGSPVAIYLFANGLIVIAVPGKKPLNVSSIRPQASS